LGQQKGRWKVLQKGWWKVLQKGWHLDLHCEQRWEQHLGQQKGWHWDLHWDLRKVKLKELLKVKLKEFQWGLQMD